MRARPERTTRLCSKWCWGNDERAGGGDLTLQGRTSARAHYIYIYMMARWAEPMTHQEQDCVQGIHSLHSARDQGAGELPADPVHAPRALKGGWVTAGYSRTAGGGLFERDEKWILLKADMTEAHRRVKVLRRPLKAMLMQ